MKKKKKLKWKNIITVLFIIICIVSFTYSMVNIITWFIDNNKTEKQIEDILNKVEINEIPSSNPNDNPEINQDEPSEDVNETDDDEIFKNTAYYDYLNMNLIYVDYEELKSINDSVKGWIQVNGLSINYPFVQAKDNKYYLTHSFDKSYNKAGWVFLDYRNNIDKLSRNNIIYAHGRVNTAMFGTLRTIFSSNWYKNKDNHFVKLSTETENTLWQVFSVYRIKTTSDYLQIDFNDDSEYQTFLDMLKNRSQYSFNTELSSKDKIITLSTCFDQKDKIVMHAKLIKTEKR